MTTTGEAWLPLGVEGDEAVEFTALREDVPDYFYRSLWSWIFVRFGVTLSATGARGFNVGLARQCERVLKISIADQGKYADGSFSAVQSAVDSKGPLATWRLVDFLVSLNYSSVGGASTLDTMLLESGSAWKIGERAGKIGLVKRLPDGVQVAAAAVVQHGKAGKRLAEAWESAFGVNPNPSQAYRLAIKAVEAASAPVVIPNDPDPSLGKVISRIMQGGKFRLPHLREEPNGVTSHDVLLYNLKQIWWGQYDRHDGLQASPLPDDVTQPEAESAVILALTLVGWFATGKVQE